MAGHIISQNQIELEMVTTDKSSSQFIADGHLGRDKTLLNICSLDFIGNLPAIIDSA